METYKHEQQALQLQKQHQQQLISSESIEEVLPSNVISSKTPSTSLVPATSLTSAVGADEAAATATQARDENDQSSISPMQMMIKPGVSFKK